MVGNIALPSALRQLEEQISRPSRPVEVLQALRALQYTGMEREDIVVLLERARMRNSLTTNNDDLEENALVALDMVRGQTRSLNLLWDSAEIARIYLPRVLDIDVLARALPLALTPNDLLPASRTNPLPSTVSDSIVDSESNRLYSLGHRPNRASFYRVPKGGFGTRPAAVLSPADRLVYEALATRLQPALAERLSANVVWPRTAVDSAAAHNEFSRAPARWSSDYIIRIDIESFYESISHSLLSVFLRESFDLRRDYLLAIEGLLGAVMGSDQGVPQGVPGSDAFGSAFLAPLDAFLTRSGWNFVRYVDDVLVGADSFLDGRLKLEKIDRALGDLSLRVNTFKTDIIRKETFQNNQSKSRPRLERFARALGDEAQSQLLATDDKEELTEALEELNVEEQTLWDLLYHNSIDIEDVIEQIRDALDVDDEDSQVRALYVTRVADQLRSNRRPEDVSMTEVEGDLRECLVFLSGARRVESMSDVEQLQDWFPGLAPYVSAYMVACSEKVPGQVRSFLAQWVLSERDTDWVNATLCNTFEKYASLVDDHAASGLARIASNSSSGLLTRAVAVRSLAAARRLRAGVFSVFLNDAPASLGFELMLAARTDPDGYPPEAEDTLRALERGT